MDAVFEGRRAKNYEILALSNQRKKTVRSWALDMLRCVNETVYLRLGLKNMFWDSNPAKTHSTWFQGLVKLLMSHHGKNSVRDKVIGEKCIIQIQRAAQSTAPSITEAESGRTMWRG